MADRKVTENPENTSPNDNDAYYVSVPGTPRSDKYVRWSTIKNGILTNVKTVGGVTLTGVGDVPAVLNTSWQVKAHAPTIIFDLATLTRGNFAYPATAATIWSLINPPIDSALYLKYYFYVTNITVDHEITLPANFKESGNTVSSIYLLAVNGPDQMVKVEWVGTHYTVSFEKVEEGTGGTDSEHRKGYFPTSADLVATHPTGVDGDYAIVGTTNTFWIWDTDTSAWIDTAQSANTPIEIADVNLLPAQISNFETRITTLENEPDGTYVAPAWATIADMTQPISFGNKSDVRLVTSVSTAAQTWGAFTDVLGTPAEVAVDVLIKINTSGISSYTATLPAGNHVNDKGSAITTIPITDLDSVNGSTVIIQAIKEGSEYQWFWGVNNVSGGGDEEYLEVSNFGALPATGVTDIIYVTIDNGNLYRWTGSVYVQIGGSTSSNASTTVAGVSEKATQSEVDNGTATGGTGASLFVGPTELKVITDVKQDISKDLARAWSSELLFDKREIATSTKTQDANITYTLAGSGHLGGDFCFREDVIICDGTNSINFNISGITTFLNGIVNGEIPIAGTYEVFFKYRPGFLSINWPGVSSASISQTQLSTPSNFTATAAGETQINLAWTDVSSESSYLIEVSDTGSGGWTLLNAPAANSVSYSHTGLSNNTTKYYRIKAVGDGSTTTDSVYSTASATTTAGDVIAPTATFSPSNGATNWGVNEPMTITFNEAIRNINDSEITNANVASLITLKQNNSSGTDIAFTAVINAGKTVITITPTASMGSSATVYLAVAPVEDSSGNATTTQSVTFTTGTHTYLNGTTNFLRFGDILDTELFSVQDTYFEIELTINKASLSGTHWLIAKNDSPGNQRQFYLYTSNSNIVFNFFFDGAGSGFRGVTWTGALNANENKIVLKYDGSIDTNSGLDRCVLEVNDVVQGSKTLSTTGGTLSDIIFNSSAQLAIGQLVNSAGAGTGASGYLGNAKGFKVRSNSATLIDVPLLITGTDVSGNSRNGTWV